MIRAYEIHANLKIAQFVANCTTKYQLCRAMLPPSGRRDVRNSHQRVFLVCQLSGKDRPIDISRVFLFPSRPLLAFPLLYIRSRSITPSNTRTWVLLLFTPSIVSFASRRKKTFEEQWEEKERRGGRGEGERGGKPEVLRDGNDSGSVS